MASALEPQSGRNRERILGLLLHAPGPISIPALAAQLGVSRNAAHQHVNSLERDGLIERAALISTRGRPSQGFQLSPAGEARLSGKAAGAIQGAPKGVVQITLPNGKTIQARFN